MAEKIITAENKATYFSTVVSSHVKNMFSQKGYATVEAYYGPYESKELAHTCMVERYRSAVNIPRGRTVAVIENGSTVEYQYKKETPEEGYTIDDLELKQSSGVSSWNDLTDKPSWIGEDKPTYTADEVGAASEQHNHDDEYAPISHNHDNYLTEHQDISGKQDKYIYTKLKESDSEEFDFSISKECVIALKCTTDCDNWSLTCNGESVVETVELPAGEYKVIGTLPAGTYAMSHNPGHGTFEVYDKSTVSEILQEHESRITAMQHPASVDTTNNLIRVKAEDGATYVVAAQKLETPAVPTIEASGSNTSANRSVTLKCSTSGAIMHYTTDGSTPTASSTRYTSAIALSASASEAETSVTVKAIAIKNGLSSDVATLKVTTARHLATPSISASGNEYSTSRTITLACSTPDSVLYYTTDGSEPSTSSTLYEETFAIDSTKTVKVLAVKDGWQNSANSSSVTVGTLKMYKGLVESAPTTEDEIKDMTAVEQKALPLTYAITTSGQYKVCVAYNKSLADLTSIKDGNGTEYLGNFDKTTVGNYKVYCMTAAGDQSGITYTFK